MKRQHKQFIQAFIDCDFNITKTCETIGIARQTFYNWIDKIDDFSHLLEESKEQAIDMTESALMKKIKEGDIRAIIFFLRTKGKKRGYTEKTEIDLNHTIEPVQIILPDNNR